MSKNNDTESSETILDTEDVASDSETASCIYDDTINFKVNRDKKELKGDARITRNMLTRYEMVRIIGERTKQLSMGAKALIKMNKETEELTYKELAIEELKLNMLPFKIKRPHYDSYEIWKLEELRKEHLESFF